MGLIFSLSICVYPRESLIIATGLRWAVYRSAKESPDKLGDLEGRTWWEESGDDVPAIARGWRRPREGCAEERGQKGPSTRDLNLA